MSGKCDTAQWFVLNFFRQSFSKSESAQVVVDKFNTNNNWCIELYAPKIIFMEVVDDKIISKEKPLTYHYVFVKGTFCDVKKLCTMPNGFSFLLNASSENRYGIVSDAAMAGFMQIARSYECRLPFYNIEDIDLEKGDYVEVVGGKYSGLKGIFIPKAKSTKGKIVIAATGSLGSIAWDVETRYIRVIQFSRETKRPYDIIDSFIPKLFKAMREYKTTGHLSSRNIGSLSIFCQRMGVVKLEDNKLKAKLSAILMCAQLLLGDHTGYMDSKETFGKYRKLITNKWTTALVSLLVGISENNNDSLIYGWNTIKDMSDKLTESQKQIKEEYKFFLEK